jgi:hypothetical protein
VPVGLQARACWRQAGKPACAAGALPAALSCRLRRLVLWVPQSLPQCCLQQSLGQRCLEQLCHRWQLPLLMLVVWGQAGGLLVRQRPGGEPPLMHRPQP